MISRNTVFCLTRPYRPHTSCIAATRIVNSKYMIPFISSFRIYPILAFVLVVDTESGADLETL
jgi:hypothetical protein